MPGEAVALTEPSELDSAPVGKELTRADYLVLGVTGAVIPALLLVWGWL